MALVVAAAKAAAGFSPLDFELGAAVAAPGPAVPPPPAGAGDAYVGFLVEAPARLLDVRAPGAPRSLRSSWTPPPDGADDDVEALGRTWRRYEGALPVARALLAAGFLLDLTPDGAAPDSGYATRADMARRYGDAEMDALAPVGEDGASRAEAVLADASAEIDGRLALRYRLPLPAGDWPQLRAAACQLARSRLYDEEKPQAVLADAAAARKRLEEISDGRIVLVAADGTAAEPADSAEPAFDGPARTFGGAALDAYLRPGADRDRR